ncbi:MAG: YDG domain-containing protein [Christensenellales bacterium]
MARNKYIIMSVTILLLSVAMILTGATADISYGETSGPSIGYTINEGGWRESKTISIEVFDDVIISQVTINDEDASVYLVSEPDDYYKEYIYTATSDEDIVIAAGNADGEINSVTIYGYELFIDTVEPEFGVSVTGVAGAWTAQNVTLTFNQINTVTSGYTYYQSSDGDSFTEIQGNSVTYSVSGDYTYYYKAVSGSGIEFTYPDPYNIKIDKVSPAAPVAGLSTDYYTDLTVEFPLSLVSDGLSAETVYYTIDGTRPVADPLKALTMPDASITFPANGSYTLRLLTIDEVGNEGIVRTFLVKVDDTDYTVDFGVNPLGGGSVSIIGEGINESGGSLSISAKRGAVLTLIADEAEGYIFRDITEGGFLVSYENIYTFTVNGNAGFIANFIKILTISADELEFTYDGAPKPVSVSDNSETDLSAYTQVLYNGSPTAPTNAGEYDVVVIIDHPDYYGYQLFNMVIYKAPAVIDVDEDTLEQVYGSVVPVAVEISIPPEGAVLTILYDGNTALPVNAGEYALTISITSDNYYYYDDTTYVLTILKADVSIVLNDKTVTYNGNPVSVSPASTIPGNLAVYYVYYDELMGVIPGAPEDAGIYYVKAFYDGDDNYNSGESNTATLTINKKQLYVYDSSVTLVKVYDGTDSAEVLYEGSLPGVIDGDEVYISSAVATYDSKYVSAEFIYVRYTISGSDSDNYITPPDFIFDETDGVEITPLQLTISAPVLINDGNKIYDGTTVASVTAGSFDNLIDDDDVTVTATAHYDVKDITANIITVSYEISGDDSDNYYTPVDETYGGSISPKPLSVINTVVNKVKDYDGTVGAEITDDGELVGVIDISGLEDVGFTVTAEYNSKNVLDATEIILTFALTGSEKGNYITPESIIIDDGVEINPLKLIAQYTVVKTKVYDGSLNAESEFVMFDNLIEGDSVTCTTYAEYNDINVLFADTITIMFSIDGDDAANYSAPDDCYEEGNISPRKIIMNAPGIDEFKVYDATKDATNVVINNGAENDVQGDDINITHTAEYNSKDVFSANSITVTYYMDGDDADNYIAPDQYTIEDAVIYPLQLDTDGTLEVALSKEYDSTTDATIINPGALKDVYPGDEVNFTLSASFNVKDTTADKITVMYTLSGAHKDNYVAPVDVVIDEGIEITPYALSISAPNDGEVISKVYDGLTDAEIVPGELIGVFLGDEVGVTAEGEYSDINVSDSLTVAVVYTLTGADAINYTLDEEEASGEILKRKIIMGDPELTPKYYDGNTGATSAVTIGQPINIISGDMVTISYSAEYDGYKVTEVTKVTVIYTISGGAQAGNYDTPDIYEILNATIKPKPLGVEGTQVNGEKFYNGTASANIINVGSLTGIVADDLVGLNAVASYNSKYVKQANEITVVFSLTGDDASNYEAPSDELFPGIIKELKLIIDEPDIELIKVYDGTNTAALTPGELINKIDGDLITVTATALFNTKNVGANTVTLTYNIDGAHKDNYIRPDPVIYNEGVSITPLEVNINYSNLIHVYNGYVRRANAEIIDYDTVKHAEFVMNLIYTDNDLTVHTDPVNAGSYTVSVNMSGVINYTCSNTAEFIINPAVSFLTLENVSGAYTGITPEIPTLITNETGDELEGVPVVYTYYIYSELNEMPWSSIDWQVYQIEDFIWEEVEGDAPARAGCYKVVGSIAEGANYTSTSYTALIIINKARAEVSFISETLNQYYGEVTHVGVSITPATSEGNPIGYNIYYNDIEELPEYAGDYTVRVVIEDYNYFGSVQGTLKVNKRSASSEIVLEQLKAEILGDMNNGFYMNYNGLTYFTTDFNAYVDVEGLEELELEITFHKGTVGIGEIVNAGLYKVKATINNVNIAGEVEAELEIYTVEAQITHNQAPVKYTGEMKSASGAVVEYNDNVIDVNVIYYYSYDEGTTYESAAPKDVGVYSVKLVIDDINYYGEIISTFEIIPANTLIGFTLPIPVRIEIKYTGSEVVIGEVISFEGDEVQDKELVYTFTKDGEVLDEPPVNVGDYKLQISFKNRDNFINPDSDIVDVIITKATPTITLEDTTVRYSGDYQTIIPTIYPPELAVNVIYHYYEAVSTGAGYVQGDELFDDDRPKNPGNYFIVAVIEDGGENYTGASSEPAILTIIYGLAEITAVAGTLTQEYDGDSKVIQVTTNPEGLNVEFEYRTENGTLIEEVKLPGSYTVKVIISDDEYEGETTFDLTITKRNMSHFIEFEGLLEVVYDGNTKSLSPKVDDILIRENFKITYNNNNSPPKNAGTYEVVAVINHALYMGQASAQLVITKKTLTVEAKNTTVQYGNIDAIIPVEYKGFAGNDTMSVLTSTAAIRIINDDLGINRIGFGKEIIVGTYNIIPVNATAQNYSFNYIGAILTVTKAPLKVKAVKTEIMEGKTPYPIITYSGFITRYNDNADNVFGSNKPVIYYYHSDTVFNTTAPTAPGEYRIIPQGGSAANYELSYEENILIIQKPQLKTDKDEIILDGVFHPDTVLSLNNLEKRASAYKAASKALREESIIKLNNGSFLVSLTLDDSPIPITEKVTFKILIPEKLRGKEFNVYMLDSEGIMTEIQYTIEGNYAIGTLKTSEGTIIFSREINVKLILIIVGGLVLIVGSIFLFKYLKKMKEESPKELSKVIAPVVVAPLEALEDEDAAFDAYINKMVEENAQYNEEEEKKEEEDIELDINEEDYTKEEIEKLKEKARKAKYKSVEQRVTEEVERQLVESFSETKRDIEFKEVAPLKAQEIRDESDITDDYIIENELYPNSNTISMEEAQALYPGRGIRRAGNNVALEVCFESALNLAPDKYKYIYSEIKNTFYKYLGIESRIFKSGEAFKGGTSHAVLRMRNEYPVLYMNLGKEYIPEDARYTDRSSEPKYKDMPIELIVTDGKQLTCARKMINALMMLGGLEFNPDYKYVNYTNKYPNIENAILDEA